MLTRSILSPAERDRLIDVHRLEGLHRAADRAAAGEKGLCQLTDGLLRWVADGEVAEKAADHGRERVPAGVEPARVVGEGDLGVGGHAHNIHGYLR